MARSELLSTKSCETGHSPPVRMVIGSTPCLRLALREHQ